jgi:pantothenate kinase
MDRVWFVTSEEDRRVERLVARHVEFGKSPDAAKAWVAGTDQPNAELVSPTAATADLVIVNGSDGWLISP